jgi:hypothetical protein
MRRTTAQRGLGGQHQKTRTRMLATMPEGSPCPRCGLPMYTTPELAERAQLHPKLWHVDLDHVIPRAMGGTHGAVRLMHRHCNRRQGTIMLNKLRAAQRRTRNQAPAYTRW